MFSFFSFTGCHLSAKQQQVWLITSAASARVAAAEAMAWPCCNSGKKVGLLQQTSHSSQSGLSLSDGKTVDTHTLTLAHTHTHTLSLSPCLAYFLNGGCHFSAPLSVNLSACSLSLSLSFSFPVPFHLRVSRESCSACVRSSNDV